MTRHKRVVGHSTLVAVEMGHVKKANRGDDDTNFRQPGFRPLRFWCRAPAGDESESGSWLKVNFTDEFAPLKPLRSSRSAPKDLAVIRISIGKDAGITVHWQGLQKLAQVECIRSRAAERKFAFVRDSRHSSRYNSEAGDRLRSAKEATPQSCSDSCSSFSAYISYAREIAYMYKWNCLFEPLHDVQYRSLTIFR